MQENALKTISNKNTNKESIVIKARYYPDKKGNGEPMIEYYELFFDNNKNFSLLSDKVRKIYESLNSMETKKDFYTQNLS